MNKIEVSKEKYISSLKKGNGKKYAVSAINADNTTRFDNKMSSGK